MTTLQVKGFRECKMRGLAITSLTHIVWGMGKIGHVAQNLVKIAHARTILKFQFKIKKITFDQ